jgi:hypothetical protein
MLQFQDKLFIQGSACCLSLGLKLLTQLAAFRLNRASKEMGEKERIRKLNLEVKRRATAGTYRQ